MDRIVTIHLRGFKGPAGATYDLSAGPTILQGPNGVGKSACLEGLVYALTGHVPGGKKLDAVAAYFPPRGGSVQVVDTAGRWIERGIKRERTKVSEVLSTSDTKEGADEPNLSAWQVSEVVLDVREFTALSPEKRREYVLRLCGGGDAPADLYQEIKGEYAREIAGAAATAETLGRLADLPSDVKALAVAWTLPRGVGEVLQSHLGSAANGKSLSEVFLRLGEVARENTLGSRKAAVEATAALRELEAEAHGAKAAAAEIAALRTKVEELRGEMSAYQARAARRDEARKRLSGAEARVNDTRGTLEADRLAAGKAPAPGERPAAPGQDPRIAEARKRIDLERVAIAGLRAERGKLEAAIDEQIRAVHAVQGCRMASVAVDAMPLGRVVQLLEEIPDEADPGIPQLREAVEDAAAGWRGEQSRLRQDLEAAEEAVEKAREPCNAAAIRLADCERDCIAHEKALAEIQADLLRIDSEGTAADTTYQKCLDAWAARDKAHRVAADRLAVSKATVSRAEAELSEAKRRLAAIETVNGEAFPKLEETESKFYKAQEALQKAEAAAGAVQAYESASSRAENSRVDEEAWKRTEAAVRTLRERLVGSSTLGLLADLREVLAAAGREETVYLDLENDRGKPIFDLGWIRGEARTSLTALSAGESVLFLSALSVALTRRSPGRRVLLVEADPLDTANLEALLRALAPQADTLEALVVATAAEGWKAPSGWAVRRLGSGL